MLCVAHHYSHTYHLYGIECIEHYAKSFMNSEQKHCTQEYTEHLKSPH
jgi:hypothetical protein